MITKIVDHQNLQVLSRSYLSIMHLSSACLFAAQAGKIEQVNTAGSARASDALREHIAHVTSTTMLSTAFLEATINEIFSDCADNYASEYNSLPGSSVMGVIWNHGVPRTAKYTILQKYNKALEVHGKRQFKEGEVTDLIQTIKLRNALIHFEPETVLTYSSEDRDPSEIHKFEKTLANKFPLSPLADLGDPFYPNKILGHGCAVWAIKTAVSFTDAFFALLGIRPKYDGIRAFVTEAEGPNEEGAQNGKEG